jgi:hypothetical protein
LHQKRTDTIHINHLISQIFAALFGICVVARGLLRVKSAESLSDRHIGRNSDRASEGTSKAGNKQGVFRYDCLINFQFLKVRIQDKSFIETQNEFLSDAIKYE